MRVLDMREVDLSRYVFDWDLTFAVLFMHPDGHIYHQYGNRDETDAQSHISMASLAATMRRTAQDHASYASKPVERPKPYTVEDIPPMARRVKKDGPKGCVHCHTVYDMVHEDKVEKKTWKRDDVWAWPPSSRVGFRLDRDDQTRVTHVEKGTPADRAGLKAGDRLVSFAGRPVATEGDVQWGLEETPRSGGSVPFTFARGDEEKLRRAKLTLGKGWREAGPKDLAYRNSVWKIGPRPGFGGKKLTPEALKAAGLPEDAFALEIRYLVNWGKHKASGAAARKAGLRKGDVCLSFDGKSDFATEREWHAWFRLTRTPGKKVAIEVLRGGKRQTLELVAGPAE